MAISSLVSLALGALGLCADKALRGPLYAQIGISDLCNHRCAMCWDHPPKNRLSPELDNRFGELPPLMMSLADFQMVANDLADLGTRRLDLVARGEPLLNKAAMEMVSYAKQKGFYVDMVSNASLLTAGIAEKMVESDLDRLQVSLNAGRAETYPAIHVTETPEDFHKIKTNLRYLIDYRKTRNKKNPYLRIGFVISKLNYFELAEMVSLTAELGADEAVFSHTTIHAGTSDLMLDDDDYRLLLSDAVKTQKIAERLNIQTNLASFAATPPPYKVSVSPDAGPAVVPCYVGWYSVMILGNGSVMGCCQCTRSLGVAGETNHFKKLWNSKSYRAFRKAARKLPDLSSELDGCECDNCSLRARNLSVYNMLHPLSPIGTGDDAQLFTIADLLRRRKKSRG